MKPGTSHSFVKKDDGTYLCCQNLALKEFMDIKLNKIHFANSHPLVDGQKLTLVGSERDMSDMIYANPELISDDFKPVSREEQTKYGFIDVFGHDGNGNLIVVECKRYGADLSTVQQLRRYVEKIKESKGIDNVRGIVAAPKITGNAEKMLNDWGFSFVSVNPPKYKERYDKKQRSLAAW